MNCGRVARISLLANRSSSFTKLCYRLAMINPRHMRRRFNSAAKTFDDADFVHAATRDGLLARLEPLLVDADVVLDLGSATGTAHKALAKRFRGSKLIAADFSEQMLLAASRKRSWLSKTKYIAAAAEALPFRSASFDVVFANMLLPCVLEPHIVFAEVARVLKPGGVFAFATLGPDSLRELQQAWSEVDELPHVHRFLDMHDLGDGLVNAGLLDPVLDVDRLKVRYRSADALFKDLTACGARNSLLGRKPTLTGKSNFARMRRSLANEQGEIALDLELVYGHCWGNGPKKDPSNYQIDATAIPIRTRR